MWNWHARGDLGRRSTTGKAPPAQRERLGSGTRHPVEGSAAETRPKARAASQRRAEPACAGITPWRGLARVRVGAQSQGLGRPRTHGHETFARCGHAPNAPQRQHSVGAEGAVSARAARRRLSPSSSAFTAKPQNRVKRQNVLKLLPKLRQRLQIQFVAFDCCISAHCGASCF